MTALPFGPQLADFTYDSNSGLIFEVLPGSYAGLGEQYAYVVQVDGYYECSANIRVNVAYPIAQTILLSVQMIHIDSIGELKTASDFFSNPAPVDGTLSGAQPFTIPVQDQYLCTVGDIVFLQISALFADASTPGPTVVDDALQSVFWGSLVK